MWPMEEKRKLKRLQLNLPVHVHLLNEKLVTISESETHGTLHDFSAGGCAFYHKERIPVGDHVQLRIELNDELSRKYSMRLLTVRGKVVRAIRQDGDYLLSVRFSIDR
jgi:c-di-GMP-binding flagellar brake protein YcgR